MSPPWTRPQSIIRLLLCLLLCFAVAAFGALFAPGEWYAGLNKPSWTPPNWLFGPVWSTLYLAMAVAWWLAWRSAAINRAQRRVHAVFLGQLVLNAAWSALFFGAHLVALALVDIGLMIAAILATIIIFWRHSRLAAALLIPYLIWVSYASSLNLGILLMN